MGKTNRTFSLTDEYNEIFEQRRNELGMSVTAYFEHLIDTEHKKAEVAKPVEVIKDNPEHLKKIAELEEEIAGYKNVVDEWERAMTSTQREKERIEMENQQLKSKTILQLDPLNVKILTYVAVREGNKRKQEWSISDVVNYFVHYRFEVGTLNGGFDSVPDNIIEQLKKEVENV